MIRKTPWVQLFLLLVGTVLYLLMAYRLGYARHNNDFKHIYLGMQAICDGYSPYPADVIAAEAARYRVSGGLNPYVYLPFTGLSLSFLKPFAFGLASDIWYLINHLCILLSVWFFAQAVAPRWLPGTCGIALTALATSHPLMRTLTAGQLNAVLLLCYSGAFLAFLRNREVVCGSVLGFAAMFKIAPGIFIVSLAGLKRWRATAAMVVTCAVLLAVSLGVAGVSVHRDFLPMLRDMSYGRSTWYEHGARFWKDPANQSANSLLTHLLVPDNGIARPWLSTSQQMANRITTGFTTLLLAGYALAVYRARRAQQNPASSQPAAAFHATIMLSLLIPSLMWDHYLLIALLPAGWMLATGVRLRRWGVAACAAVIIILFNIPWPYDSPTFSAGWKVTLISMKLFPALGLYALLCIESCRSTSEVFASPACESY